MNKIKLIRKSLQGLKRYQILFIVSVMLCMLVFSYYVIMNHTTKVMELEKTKQTFGSYTYYIGDLTEEKIKIIEDDSNTKEFCLLTSAAAEENLFLYADEKLFSFTNYSIIEGNFPESKNELLAPKWYLFQLGIDTDHMVGSPVTVTDPQTGEKVSRTVSGIYTVQDSSNGSDTDNTPVFIAPKDKSLKAETYDIYVELKSVSQIDAYITQLKEKLNLDEYQNCLLNDELLRQMKVTEEGKSEGRREIALYGFLILAFLIFIGMVQKTLVRLCLARWEKVLSTYKLLGVNMNELRNYILCSSALQTLAGLILGTAGGYAAAYFFLKGSIQYWEIQIPLIVNIPYGIILSAAGILMALTILIVCLNLRKFNKNSAYAVLNKHNRDGISSRISFYKTSKCRRIKYALCNSLYYIRQKSGILFTVILCMLLVTFLDTQLKQSVKQVDNNNQYEYKFDVIDYFSLKSEEEIKNVKTVYNKLIQLLTEKKKTIYYETCSSSEFKLEKELLTPEYIEKLKTDLNGYYQYLSDSSAIDTNIAIMGYSPDMLREMFGNDFQLSDDQAVMLSRTVDNEHNNSVPIESAIGKKYQFNTSIYYENEEEQSFLMTEKTVAATTEDLLVYPPVDKETVCVVVNLDEYNHCFNNDFINSFYIKELNKDELSEVQNLLQGIDSIHVTNQKEELKQQEMNEAQKTFLLYMILILSNLLAGISLLLQEIHEMDIRKKDFDFLKTLGVSNKDCSCIVGIELTIVNFAGLLFGYLLSKICFVVLHEMAYLQSSTMNGFILLFCLILAAGYTIISYFIVRKILSSSF